MIRQNVYSNFVVNVGTTFQKTLDIRNEDGTVPDLTNYYAFCAAQKSFHSGVDRFSLSAQIVAPALTSGKIMLSISANDSLSIKPGRYVYQLKISPTNLGATGFSSGTLVYSVYEGIILVNSDVVFVAN
jgi:hypothetical protein